MAQVTGQGAGAGGTSRRETQIDPCSLSPGPAHRLRTPLNPCARGAAATAVTGLLFPQTQHYFLLCFLLKFSLTISSCLICFGFTLQSFCDSSRVRNLTSCSSIMLPRWVPS